MSRVTNRLGDLQKNLCLAKGNGGDGYFRHSLVGSTIKATSSVWRYARVICREVKDSRLGSGSWTVGHYSRWPPATPLASC